MQTILCSERLHSSTFFHHQKTFFHCLENTSLIMLAGVKHISFEPLICFANSLHALKNYLKLYINLFCKFKGYTIGTCVYTKINEFYH